MTDYICDYDPKAGALVRVDTNDRGGDKVANG